MKSVNLIALTVVILALSACFMEGEGGDPCRRDAGKNDFTRPDILLEITINKSS